MGRGHTPASLKDIPAESAKMQQQAANHSAAADIKAEFVSPKRKREDSDDDEPADEVKWGTDMSTFDIEISGYSCYAKNTIQYFLSVEKKIIQTFLT